MGRGATPSWAFACSLLAVAPAGQAAAQAPATPFGADQAYGCDQARAVMGAIVGMVAGGIIGNQVKQDRRTARAVGILVGGLMGAAIGHELDRRSCELKKIAAENSLKLELNKISAPAAPEENGTYQPSQPMGLSVAIQETPDQFASGSDVLTPEARAYFAQIADTYVFQKQMASLPAGASAEQQDAIESLRNKVILLVGHTDDVGPTDANAALSERRARAMAQLFNERGVPISQIYYQGAGETLPIADNRTETGRARNRRVEIIDLPDVDALGEYLNARAPHLEHYRPSGSDQVALVAQPLPTESPPSSPPPPSRKPHTGRSTKAPPPLPPTPPKPPVARVSVDEWDFGGQPAAHTLPPDIGPPLRSAFSIGSRAYAANLSRAGLGSCAADRPRVAYAVRSLSNGAELPFSTADYLPGLYGGSWSGPVNGQLVALTHVSVLRDGGRPAAQPELLLYKNFAEAPDPKRRPDVRTRPHVNVYRGEKGILYRVFAAGTANVTCIDMLLPPGGGFSAPGSHLFYTRENQHLVADFNPQVHR